MNLSLPQKRRTFTLHIFAIVSATSAENFRLALIVMFLSNTTKFKFSAALSRKNTISLSQIKKKAEKNLLARADQNSSTMSRLCYLSYD